MSWFYTLLAIAAGAMLPLQAALNARLARVVGSPVWAAAISGLVLTVTLCLVALATLRSGPRTVGMFALPWWAWTGGLCGAIVLSATTAVAPRLGAATMIALVMTGQVVASLALDNFGGFGLQMHSIDGKRAVAAALLISGAVLMR